MPIPVRCQCGQSFSAKDELAGRTLKCPKCQSPLTIPTPGQAAPVAAKAASAKAPAARPQPAAARAPAGPQQPAAQDYGLQAPVPIAAPTNSLFSDLLDEAGMASAHKGEQECPNCRKPMPVGAILCIKCGFHLQHRVKIQGVAQKGEADAHGDVATTALANAAQALDKDKEDIKKETGEGLPWYAVAAMLLGVIGFIAAMLLLPPQIAFLSAGGTLIGLAVLIWWYAQIMIFRNAMQESMTQFVLVFCIPPYRTFYVFTRWDRNAGFYSMQWGAILVALAGCGMIWLAPMMKREGKEEGLRFERNRPAIVCSSELGPSLLTKVKRTPVEFV